MRKITDRLILALAIIAAIVAKGIAAEKSMWAWIVVYWIVLATKNALDCIERYRRMKEDKGK